MEAKKVIWIMVIAIVAIGAIWIIFGDHPGEEEASIPDSPPVSQDNSYSNIDMGFTAKIPSDYEIDESYIYTNLGPDREIRGVSFKIPESLTVGTNLSRDTHISIERLKDVDCHPRSFLYSEPTNIETVRRGNYTFITGSTSGAGTGNFYEESVYTTRKNDYCYAIRYYMHSTNIGNYEPGTVQVYDRDALLASFDKIVSSFIIN
jgi:hypothetical protein